MEALDVLAAFGSTGRVGLLHPGARLREVVAAYGMPWDIGRIDKRHRWSHLYSYGDVEFVVCRCRIITSVTVQTWRGTVELPSQAQSGEVIALPARLTSAHIKALAAYLGHADAGFTLRIYTHLLPTSEDRTRRAIDKAFGEDQAADDGREARDGLETA
ncbi:hypothetical protein [Micromonospora coerulea]